MGDEGAGPLGRARGGGVDKTERRTAQHGPRRGHREPLPFCFSAKTPCLGHRWLPARSQPGGTAGPRSGKWALLLCSGCAGSPRQAQAAVMLVPSAFGPARPRGAEVHGVRDTWVCAVWGFLDRDSHVPGQSCQLSPGGWGLAGQRTYVLLAPWLPGDCLRVLRVRQDAKCQTGSMDCGHAALCPV